MASLKVWGTSCHREGRGLPPSSCEGAPPLQLTGMGPSVIFCVGFGGGGGALFSIPIVHDASIYIHHCASSVRTGRGAVGGGGGQN